MSYIRTTWVARVGTALNRFLKTNETETSVELTNDPTGVSVAGTPFTVANMNKIEDGIYDNSVKLDTIEDSGTLQGLSTESSPTFANYRTRTLVTSVDLDTIIDNGHYYVTTGGANNPSSDYCALLVVGNADIKSQTLIEIGSNKHWHRIGAAIGEASESWTAWRLIDQDLSTTASPTFNSLGVTGAISGTSINTGLGAFLIGQNLRTTDSPTFAAVNTGYGDNEVYKISEQTIAFGNVSGTNKTMSISTMDSKEIRMVNTTGSIGSNDRSYHLSLKLPAGGTYFVVGQSAPSPNRVASVYGGVYSGGTIVAQVGNDDYYNIPFSVGLIVRRI